MDQPSGPNGTHGRMGLSDEDLNTVLSNTAAVLGPVSGKLEEWRETVEQNAQRAAEEGHEDIAAFLGAILQLLNRGVEALDEIGAGVPDAYEAAWEALSAHVRGEPVRGLTKSDIQLLLTNTLAVLLKQPEMRPQWREQLTDAAGQAQQAGDPDAAGFLSALIRLIDEGKGAVDDISGEVPEPYRNPWEALRRYLADKGR